MKALLLAVAALCLPLSALAQDAAPATEPSASEPPAPTDTASAGQPAEAAAPAEAEPAPPPATETVAEPAAAAAEAPAAPEAPEQAAPQSAGEVGTIAVQGTEPAAAPALPLEQAPNRIDEVVVTAQKTKQSARKVPLSITALDGAQMKQVGAASLADVSLYVPNVRVDAHDPGSPQVFIRGFGTNAFNPSFESSVAFVQDDLYFGRPGYFTESMFDIERIEVLRGPQGTLFGKNTVAGVFNVISKGPEGDPSVDGSVYYGNHNERRVEGGAGGMLTDWLGARIAGFFLDKDGQLYNDFLNRYEDKLRQEAGRLKLKLAPGNGFESELTAAHSRTNAPFWPFELMNLDSDTTTYLRGFDPKVEGNPYDFTTSFDTQGWIDKGSDTVSVRTHWDHGSDFGAIHDFDPVLVLGWSRFHIDQLNELDVSPADIARLDSHERHRQLSAELRFTGRTDSLLGLGTGVQFVGGAFWFKSRYDLFARVLAGQDLPSYLLTKDACQLLAASNGLDPSVCGPLGILALPGLSALGSLTSAVTNNDYYQFNYGQDIDSTALFGQFTWNITDKIAVTPGLRLSRENKGVDANGQSHCQTKDSGLGGPCVMEQVISSSDYHEPSLDKSEFDASPKLALQYFADHGVNYYTSYAKGYKSGGFNAISLKGGNLQYEPEKAQTWELGAKARFFDNTLSWNLTLYQTHFDNLQVLAFNGLFFDVSNAGTARSRGLETDFLWLTPYAPLRIAGSGGLLNAIYLKYDGAPAPIEDGIGQKQSLAGQRIAFAPRSSATLTPTLTYPFFGDLMLTFSGDVIWQGNQFVDTNLDPKKYVGGYTKFAARMVLAHPDGRWSISLGGNNLSDKRVLNQVVDATFFPGSYFAQQAAGRTVFGMVTFKL
ncbi:MAG TPA: TonB-dependent receptor [Nevskiaceae bacterium]|nr:TonB-dependent receptor [Nevskiaceae bacterium]